MTVVHRPDALGQVEVSRRVRMMIVMTIVVKIDGGVWTIVSAEAANQNVSEGDNHQVQIRRATEISTGRVVAANGDG